MKQIVDKYLGNPAYHQHSSDEYAYYCPVCHWKNPRLMVNFNKNTFHCWKCNWGGKDIAGILFKLNVDINVIKEFSGFVANSTKFKGKKRQLRSIKDEIHSKLFVEQSTKLLPNITIPDGFERLSDEITKLSNRIGVNYLLNRGLSVYEIWLYQIMYNAKNRTILIPSYKEDKLDYYVLRNIDRGYMLPDIGVKKYDVIFFEGLINFSEPVILTEGVFDAIKIGYNSIPLLGVNISPLLISTLLINKTPEVILYLDNDAYESSLKSAKKLFSKGVNISLCKYNLFKDAGETDRKNIIEILNNRQRIDKKWLIKNNLELM